MSDQSLRDDISFLRGLAEAGRDRPVGGGAMLVAAGVIFGLASLLNWLILTHRIALPVSLSVVWNGAWMLFVAVWIAIALWMRNHRLLPLDPANRIFGIAWSASGVSIFVMIGAELLAYRNFHDPVIFALTPSAIAVFYGAAWLVSAAAARRSWMLAVAVASFVSALVFASMANTADLMLAFAIALIVIILLPGLRLMTLSKA